MRGEWYDREWEEGEDLLGVLEETDAAELIVGNAIHGTVPMIPFVGGEDGDGLVAAQEVANDFRTLGHEAVFTLAELLLFQLTDIFYLIFANHLSFCLQR